MCEESAPHTRNFSRVHFEAGLRELFLHRYMRTDPNWANFHLQSRHQQDSLLDFGATREFRPEFVNTYLIIDCAATRTEKGVQVSREIGSTGNESKFDE